MPIWDISVLNTQIKDGNICRSCGICQDCFKCQKCESLIKADAKGIVKKVCPSCGTKLRKLENSFTHIINHKCEHCGSMNIKPTRTNKTTCPKCENSKLEIGKTKDFVVLTFTRKIPFKLNNI